MTSLLCFHGSSDSSAWAKFFYEVFKTQSFKKKQEGGFCRPNPSCIAFKTFYSKALRFYWGLWAFFQEEIALWSSSELHDEQCSACRWEVRLCGGHPAASCWSPQTCSRGQHEAKQVVFWKRLAQLLFTFLLYIEKITSVWCQCLCLQSWCSLINCLQSSPQQEAAELPEDFKKADAESLCKALRNAYEKDVQKMPEAGGPQYPKHLHLRKVLLCRLGLYRLRVLLMGCLIAVCQPNVAETRIEESDRFILFSWLRPERKQKLCMLCFDIFVHRLVTLDVPRISSCKY